MFNTLLRQKLIDIRSQLIKLSEKAEPITSEDNIAAVMSKLDDLITTKGLKALSLESVKYSTTVRSEHFNEIIRMLNAFINETLSILDDMKTTLNERSTDLASLQTNIETNLTNVTQAVAEVEKQVMQRAKLSSVYNQEIKNIDFTRGYNNGLTTMTSNILTRKIINSSLLTLTSPEYSIVTPNAKYIIDGPDWENNIPTGTYEGRIIGAPAKMVPKNENALSNAFDNNVNTSWIMQYVNNINSDPYQLRIIGKVQSIKHTAILNISTNCDTFKLLMDDTLISPIAPGKFIVPQEGTASIVLETTYPSHVEYHGGKFSGYKINPVIHMLFNGEDANRWFNVPPEYQFITREGIGNIELTEKLTEDRRADIPVSEVEINNITIDDVEFSTQGGVWLSNKIKTYSDIYAIELAISGIGFSNTERNVILSMSFDGENWDDICPVNFITNFAYSGLPIRIILDVDKAESIRYKYMGKINHKAFYLKLAITDNSGEIIITNIVARIKTQRETI